MLFSNIVLALISLSATPSLAASTTCSKVTVRKEVHDMSDREVEIFKDTIRRAITTKDSDVPSKSIWQAAADLHNANARIIHNNAAFFFWHRMFLVTMERKLQKLNPDFYFPYWDTSGEYKNGEWQKSIAISMTDLSDTAVKTNRDLQHYDQVSPSEWSQLLQESVRNGKGFQYFAPSPQAELLHGTLHVSISGDMSVMIAPRDPLFYLHHGHLDYLWSQAQVDWSSKGYPQVGTLMSDGVTVSTLDTPLPTYPKNKFGDVINLGNLCVRYAAPGEVVTTTTTSTSSTSTTTATSSTSTTPATSSTTQSSSSTITATTSSVSSTTLSTTSNVPSISSTTASTTSATSTGTLSSSTKSSSQTTSSTSTQTSSSTQKSRTSSTSSSRRSTSTYSTITGRVTSSTRTATTTSPLPTSTSNADCIVLPSAWLAMNNIPETHAQQAYSVCKQVYQNVSQGISYPPLPKYSDQEYTEAIQSVLPSNYTVNPPTEPIYDAVYSSGHRSLGSGMLLAGGLFVFTAMC